MHKKDYLMCLVFAAVVCGVGCRDDEGEMSDTDGGNSTDGSNPNNNNNNNGGLDGNWDGEGEACYDANAGLTSVATRVMLLEDASTSMNDDNKWRTAVAAITGMVDTFGESIEFGLDTFPVGSGGFGGGGDVCGVGESVAIDVALDNGDAIVDYLSRTGPNGATPLYLGMANFMSRAYAPVFSDGATTAYLVIISDGQDTCGTNGVFDRQGGASAEELAEMTRILRVDHDIRTIVIGFGQGADPGQLNAIAAEGGTPFTEFLNASDGDELADALNQIGETVVVSCAYDIGEYELENVNLNRVYIAFDDDPVFMNKDCDGGIGWRWTNDSREVIEFCEQSCEQLETGVEVVVKIACEGGVV